MVSWLGEVFLVVKGLFGEQRSYVAFWAAPIESLLVFSKNLVDDQTRILEHKALKIFVPRLKIVRFDLLLDQRVELLKLLDANRNAIENHVSARHTRRLVLLMRLLPKYCKTK